jgi:hypothetical protein
MLVRLYKKWILPLGLAQKEVLSRVREVLLELGGIYRKYKVEVSLEARAFEVHLA